MSAMVEDDFITFESKSKIEQTSGIHSSENNPTFNNKILNDNNFESLNSNNLNNVDFESQLDDLTDKPTEDNAITTENVLNMSSLTNESNNLSDVNLSDNVESNFTEQPSNLLGTSLPTGTINVANKEVNVANEIKLEDQEMMNEEDDDDDDENNLSGELL